MATRRYDPLPSEAPPKPSVAKRQSFWMNPDVYFPSREREPEVSSDSIHVNADEPLTLLFAGHVGAKGFADPHFINDRDIQEAALKGRLPSATKNDLKRDLKALDHIHRESVDDVIGYYLKDARKPPKEQRPKEPMWRATEPSRNKQTTSPTDTAASSSVHLVPVRIVSRHQDKHPTGTCPCCADVNAQNSKRRGEIASRPSAESMRIDYPSPSPSLPSPSPVVERERVIEEILQRQPLSTIIREEPAPLVPSSPLASDDLFLVYDDRNMRAGWMPFDELERFEARKGERVTYGDPGIAYINYEYPEDLITASVNPERDSRRQKMELDLLNAYGKYRDNMVRLNRHIQDLGPPRSVSPDPPLVEFPGPGEVRNVGPPPLRSSVSSRAMQRPPNSRRTPPPNRNVKFADDSPTKFLYTPLSSPDEFGRHQ